MHTTRNKPEKLLLASASTVSNPLRGVNGELQEIREIALRKAIQAGYVEIVERGSATYGTLSTVLLSGECEGITMLHYSGHAAAKGLRVERNGEPEWIESGQLKNVLQAHGALRLVFLNACYSGEIAASLTEAGVPYVIGTRRRVGDELAREVACTFYRILANNPVTVETAFRLTLDHFVHGAKGRSGETRWRSFLTEPEDAVDFPWQMYRRDGIGAQTRDWTLVPRRPAGPGGRAASPTLIREEKAYVCNRHKYLNTFEKSFDLHTGARTLWRKVNHYLIAGEERHSPLGLARKLVFEKITHAEQEQCLHLFKKHDALPIELRSGHVTARSIANQIYPHLAGREYNYRQGEIQFADFLALPRVRSKAFVVLAVEIKPGDLTEGLIGAVRAFITQFCQPPERQSGNAPTFLFFWSILYEPGAGSFLPFLNRNPLSRILEPFRDICNPATPADCRLWVLNEVDRPPEIPDKREIDQWFDNHFSAHHSYLPDKQIYRLNHVKKLENKFFNLIQQVNNTVPHPLR